MDQYIKIGDLKIKKTAALAPMASVADTAYRLICKKFKASLVFSEMVSVKGIYFNPEKSEKLLKILDEERPMGLQLFGDDPKYFLLAMPKVLSYKPDIIDINMGCPVKKVVKNSAGCSLMRNVDLAQRIVTAVIKKANCPVTVKLRKGWDDESVNVCEFAKKMQDCGVSAVTIHGRTKKQMFSGKADWEIIKKVKDNLKIPVIANGDIKTVDDCIKVYEKTSADLVMIGRASFGRPWIFKEIDDRLTKSTKMKELSLLQIFDVMEDHIKKIIFFEGEAKGLKKCRSQSMRYFHSFKSAARIRRFCAGISSFEDFSKLKDMIKEIVKEQS